MLGRVPKRRSTRFAAGSSDFVLLERFCTRLAMSSRQDRIIRSVRAELSIPDCPPNTGKPNLAQPVGCPSARRSAGAVAVAGLEMPVVTATTTETVKSFAVYVAWVATVWEASKH